MTDCAGSLRLRRATAEDEDFLVRLFAETHEGLRDLPEALRETLMQMQYRGRAASYGTSYPQAERWIFCLDGGEAVGAEIVATTQDGIRILDVAVLPGYQNRGIGTRALEACVARATAEGRSVRLAVARNNPAERLYRRLGFRRIAEDEINFEMIFSFP